MTDDTPPAPPPPPNGEPLAPPPAEGTPPTTPPPPGEPTPPPHPEGSTPKKAAEKGFFTRFTDQGDGVPPPEPSGTASPRYEHVHSPGCGHDIPASGGGAHSHGPELPKGKPVNGWVVAGVIAAVGMVAYLINEYGKRPRKDWQTRTQQPDSKDSRLL